MKRHCASAAAFVLCALAVAGCDGDHTTAVITPRQPLGPPAPVPTAIVLSPAIRNVNVGSTLQFAAAVHDASGSAISGYTINWSTSDSTIATVTPSGLVRGVADGSAVIHASAAGLTAQVQVTVSTRITLPGLVLFNDDFEAGRYVNGLSGGWWMGGNSGNVHVGPGGAFGSLFALTMTHRAKPAGAMSTAEQRFRLAQGASELWMEYDFLVPSNFFHREPDGNSNNKFLALWEENYSGVSSDGVTPTPQLIFEFRPMNDSPNRAGEVGASYVYLHGTDRTGKIHGGIGNKWLSAFGSWNRGKWVQIRVHVKMATDDATNDGIIELFADGQLVISKYDFPLHSAAGGHSIRNGYLLGWSNSGYDQDTEFKIDNVKLYSANPGW